MLIAIGFVANKTKIVPSNATETLNAFVLNIAIPCLILHTLQRNELSNGAYNDVVWAFISAIVVSIIISIFALLVMLPVKSVREEDKGVYRIQIAYTNVGFMGYPIIRVILGNYCMFLAIISNIVIMSLFYTIGVILLVYRKGEKFFSVHFFSQLITIPFMASLLGLIVFLTGFRFPFIIDTCLGYMAETLSPVSMFVIGIGLSKSNVRSLLTRINVVLCFISLLIVPTLTLGIELALGVSTQLLVTIVFVMAMPSAAVIPILCQKFKRNERIGAEGVALTTFFSLGTLPLWAFLLTRLFF